MIEARLRRLRGLSGSHCPQSLPIRGTPDDVPQPRILSFIARVTSWRRLVEKRVEIGACRSCQGIAFLTAQIGEKRQRVGDEGGLAGLAAVRAGGADRERVP